MDQKNFTNDIAGKKTWSSPSIKTINLNEARFGSNPSNTDASGNPRTKS